MKQYFAKEIEGGLMICSRDIKVGDKVRGDEISFDVLIKDEQALELAIATNHYKVIGKISPSAIWVKEGMEFDEDEIHRCFVHEKVSNLSDPMIRKVQVKGPCGHFH